MADITSTQGDSFPSNVIQFPLSKEREIELLRERFGAAMARITESRARLQKLAEEAAQTPGARKAKAAERARLEGRQ